MESNEAQTAIMTSSATPGSLSDAMDLSKSFSNYSNSSSVEKLKDDGITEYSSLGASSQTLVPNDEFGASQDASRRKTSDLDDCEWYWRNATREDVNHYMANKPDGTFLVRDSSRQGQGRGEAYTLTLKKDGSTKLIRIYESAEGKFGFSEPYEFDTISDLIKYHSSHSLVQYNRSLDITLKQVLPRPSYKLLSTKQLLQQFSIVSRNYFFTSELYNKHTLDIDLLRNNVLLQTRAVGAFDLTISLFDEQMESLVNNFGNVGVDTDEFKQLKSSENRLQNKIKDMHETKERLETKIIHENNDILFKRKEINELKPRILKAHRERELLQKELSQIREVDSARLSRITKEAESAAQRDIAEAAKDEDLSGGLSSYRRNNQKRTTSENPVEEMIKFERSRDQSTGSCPIGATPSSVGSNSGSIGGAYLFPSSYPSSGDSSISSASYISRSPSTSISNSNYHAHSYSGELENFAWYQADLSRTEAENGLKNKADGRFLIRARRNATDGAAYALSVAAGKMGVQHVLIFQSKDTKFGFVHNDCRFDSLSDLVEHYMRYSLEPHNSKLPFKLISHDKENV